MEDPGGKFSFLHIACAELRTLDIPGKLCYNNVGAERVPELLYKIREQGVKRDAGIYSPSYGCKNVSGYSAV